jgi:chromosome segregation ATPase
VNKKMIIITVIVGLVSFGGTFAAGMLKKAKHVENKENLQPLPERPEAHNPTEEKQEKQVNAIPASENTAVTVSMSEQQLKNLIRDLRVKMQDYEQRIQSLNQREQRLQIAQDSLKQDINKLTNLQTTLATITATIKNEQEKLQKSKLEINQIEKTNLVQIAGTYDKMDSSSASKIIAKMCTEASEDSQNPSAGILGSGYNDAVRILYYMTDRTKAKLLAELAGSEPKLASALSQRLKQITEK